MAVICPAVLAETAERYHQQMEKVAGFAERLQIDLTDGVFAGHRTVKPEDAWWPVGVKADFHLMYERPDKAVRTILRHQPNLIIVHAESDGDFGAFADLCHQHGVGVGVALLPKTSPEVIKDSLRLIDHVLIFSGNLGEYGGRANLDLLRKAEIVKRMKPELEVGWDGGISDQNISQLAFGGIDVFNVGGFLQTAENPAEDYRKLSRIAEETGTT
jgi:ribulose-phosphate 3-epimerase